MRSTDIEVMVGKVDLDGIHFHRFAKVYLQPFAFLPCLGSPPGFHFLVIRQFRFVTFEVGRSGYILLIGKQVPTHTDVFLFKVYFPVGDAERIIGKGAECIHTIFIGNDNRKDA